jgi:hypothetical protein
MDGLTEREISGKEKVVLPIWHEINHHQILSYSPSLAGNKAALSKNGLQQVVKEIMDFIHPQGSPLIVARDVLLEWRVTPPIVADEYWIDVIAASNRTSAFTPRTAEDSIGGRWSFPLSARY